MATANNPVERTPKNKPHKVPYIIESETGEKGFAGTVEFLEKKEKSKLGKEISQKNKLN